MRDRMVRYWAVNAIEDGIVSLESDKEERIRVLLEMLPDEVAEGDVVLMIVDRKYGESALSFFMDNDERDRRLEKARKQMRGAARAAKGTAKGKTKGKMKGRTKKDRGGDILL